MCYQRSGMTDKAIETFDEAIKNKIVPSNRMYGSLILVYANTKDYISAEKVLKEMEQKKLRIEAPAYTNLIFVYEKARMIDKCWEVFRRAEVAGAVDQYMLSYMIRLCSVVIPCSR